MTTAPLATVPTGAVDKTELSIRIVKNGSQLLEDYVLWNKCGWSDEEFGQLLGISQKTVKNRYLADARKQGLIESSKMARPNCARNRAQIVENSTPTPNPPTPVYEAEIVIDDPIVLSHAEPVSFSESRAQPYRNPAAAQRELTDQVGSEDYVRVIRLFDDINNILQQHAFRGTLSTSEWTSILGCCQSTAAVASAMHNNVQQYAGMEQRADWN